MPISLHDHPPSGNIAAARAVGRDCREPPEAMMVGVERIMYPFRPKQRLLIRHRG
jgi:hypothetical protein